MLVVGKPLVKPVGVLKTRVLEPHLSGLVVHHLDELGFAARYALGDRHGGVVARMDEQAGDEVAQGDLLPATRPALDSPTDAALGEIV